MALRDSRPSISSRAFRPSWQGGMKILTILSDPEILEGISLSFRLRWPEATLVSTEEGYNGIGKVETESPDMVLLDMTLPDMDGFEVLSEIRAFSDVPLIVITARGDEMDRVRGLEMGADDYVVKPFSYLELLARVKAVLRRTRSEDLTQRSPVAHGELMIDFQSQEVVLHGEEIKLTPTEYRLLCQLAGNIGRTLSQRSLIERVWGEEFLDTPSLLKVHIHRLRRKLEDTPDHPQIIVTVPGRGYRFTVPVPV